jgi:3-oxoacyl-[acyl-carrier protein] reductase
MDFGIKNKVALVLASSKGLGQAIAISLAKEGARVAVTGRDQADIKATVEQIQAAGGSAYALPWDLYDLTLIDQKISEVENQVGPINILVNNTGGPPPTTAANQPAELWQDNFNNLVLSLIKITDRVLPGMRERQWGRIITSTSSGMIAPIPNLAISNALRASLMKLPKMVSRSILFCRVVLPQIDYNN